MRVLVGATLIVAACFAGAYTQTKQKTLRAGQMQSQDWTTLMAGGTNELSVEFREGDVIPVTIGAEGDLLETEKSDVSYIRVKKSFWLKLHDQEVLISLDGENFKPLNQVVKGSLNAGAGSDEAGIPVNAIQLLLQLYLK